MQPLGWGNSILSHFSLRYATFEERVDAAASAGFDGIGLYIENYLELTERQGRTPNELRALLDSRAIVLAEIEVLTGWASDPSARARCDRWLDVACAMTETFGCRHLAAIGPYDGTIEDAATALARICDRADEVGLKICIEFLPFTNIRSAADAMRLIERVDRANCGITLDTWHHFRGGNDWTQLEAVPGERVVCVQVNDGARVAESDDYLADTLTSRRPLGDGEFDLRRFFDLLARKRINAPVSVEVISASLQALPHRAAARALYESLLRYQPN